MDKELFDKAFCLEFADMVRGRPGNLEEMLNKFIADKQNPEDEPEKIYTEVLTAASEMSNVTMDELESGKKYGDLPTCKQLTSKILHELGFKEKDISKNLPMLGLRITVHKQITKAGEYEESDKNFRKVLVQLRSKFELDSV